MAWDGMGWNWQRMESVNYCWTVQTVNWRVSVGSGTHTQTVYANRYISNCWDFIAPVTVVWGKLAAIKQTVDFNHDTNMHSVCF